MVWYDWYYDWCEECEDSEDYEEDIFVQIQEDQGFKVSRFQGFKHGNFVNDDFFDNFAASFGGTDSNAKNEETFHDLVPERAGHTKNMGLMFLFRCRWMRRLRFWWRRDP